MSEADCAEIDAYISGHKTLVGFMPPWGREFAGQYQARWSIADLQGVESAELCFSIARDGYHQSIVCTHRQRLIYRLCVAPETECKDNWHTAWKQGLPHVVCGTHVHGWPENRDHVLVNGFGTMPVRRKVEASVLSIADAVHWVANDLNIHMDSIHRDIPMPERGLV